MQLIKINQGGAMATVKKLSGEIEIARIAGKRMTSFFTKASTKVILTNKRVYQETQVGAMEETDIIPLGNVDSFGLMTSSKPWLLVLGIIIILFGLYYMIKNHEQSKEAVMIIFVGSIFIAAWWLTRKIGAVVHSISGKMKLSVLASASNMDNITTFITQIQETLDNDDIGPIQHDDEKKEANFDYKLIEGKTGEAFCVVCRETSPMNGMYYNKQTDTYYHKACLPKQSINKADKSQQPDGGATIEKPSSVCAKCGYQNLPEDNFCLRCGAKRET